jgi:hypothetical protein
MLVQSALEKTALLKAHKAGPWKVKKFEKIYIYKRLRPIKKSATEKRTSHRNFFLMKLNTRHLKFNKMQAVADRERGWGAGGHVQGTGTPT